MTSEVSKETKLILIQQERNNWLNTIEILVIRNRVNKRLKNEQAVQANEKELERCEIALEELDAIEKEINAGVDVSAN